MQQLITIYQLVVIAKIFVGNISGGLKDLGKAGELGIYDAYALMKKYSGEKQPNYVGYYFVISLIQITFASTLIYKTNL